MARKGRKNKVLLRKGIQIPNLSIMKERSDIIPFSAGVITIRKLDLIPDSGSFQSGDDTRLSLLIRIQGNYKLVELEKILVKIKEGIGIFSLL